uniref:ShKT domain-containing protein n=1 Tax=Wuchereria bancrofti TaxID=6293 RepID=A0A1I8EPI3_WUCBA
MKTFCILRTKLTTNIIVSCIILHCATAQRGPCIDGECMLGSDDCYEDQCYEVVGDCNENNECEHEDSKCVNSEKKANICIWLKTPKVDDDVTVPSITTPSITIPDITVPLTTIPSDECYDEISDCLKYYFLCKNKLYQSLMASFCQLTCGYCDTPYLAVLPTITPEICQDKAAPGKPSDCPLYSHLCYDPIYAELMKDQCIKTCAICEDKKGIDGKSNCKDVKHLCNVPLYVPLISIQCPLTCVLCYQFVDQHI